MKLLHIMNKYKNQIEICTRAVIRNKGKILVCLDKEKRFYFFPGGHVEFGETLEKSIKRELKEELDISIEKLRFIGVVENIYIQDKEKHCEVNFIFDVLVKKIKDKSKEDHIDFVFMNDKEFVKSKILPLSLQKNIIKWIKEKKPFLENKKRL